MGVQEKHGFKFSTDKYYFNVNKMPKKVLRNHSSSAEMDFAIFVVHSEESRLSINEDNAGIGYTKTYRALLQATGEWSGSSGSIRNRSLPLTRTALENWWNVAKPPKYRNIFWYSFKKKLKVTNQNGTVRPSRRLSLSKLVIMRIDCYPTKAEAVSG